VDWSRTSGSVSRGPDSFPPIVARELLLTGDRLWPNGPSVWALSTFLAEPRRAIAAAIALAERSVSRSTRGPRVTGPSSIVCDRRRGGCGRTPHAAHGDLLRPARCCGRRRGVLCAPHAQLARADNRELTVCP